MIACEHCGDEFYSPDAYAQHSSLLCCKRDLANANATIHQLNESERALQTAYERSREQIAELNDLMTQLRDFGQQSHENCVRALDERDAARTEADALRGTVGLLREWVAVYVEDFGDGTHNHFNEFCASLTQPGQACDCGAAEIRSLAAVPASAPDKRWSIEQVGDVVVKVEHTGKPAPDEQPTTAGQ